MKILQKSIKLKRHSRVNVTFSRPANVFLMTDKNFTRYKEGASHKRIGGWFDKAPAEFVAPYDGQWVAVIEKGAHFDPKPIEGSVEVLPPLIKEVELPGGDWGSDDDTAAGDHATDGEDHASEEESVDGKGSEVITEEIKDVTDEVHDDSDDDGSSNDDEEEEK